MRKSIKEARGEPSAGPAGLREAVREAYSSAAERPGDKHPFPLGRWFAESVGYPVEMLDRLPQAAVDSFAGVSNVSVFADIHEGASVLDIGCGAGLDALIAAYRTGPGGKVIGVDFSKPMIDRARAASLDFGQGNVFFKCTDAESIPVEDGSMDVVLVNGIFNLNPQREVLFNEIFRVLRPGGAVYASELILKEPEESNNTCDLKNWFA